MTIKYRFDLDTLQPGDILLSRGAGKGAASIAKLTGGRFSHAMIYVGNSVIHAMPDGVYSKNPQRILYDSVDDMLALRAARGLTDQQAQTVVDTARYWVGALYSRAQAAAVRAYSQVCVPTTSPLQFCSRLVAQCYQAAGIQLVVNPDYCSPNDLARSDELVPIADFSVEANEAEIQFALDTDDPNETIQRAAFTWLCKARDLAKRRGLGAIATEADVGLLIAEHPPLDKVICNYVRTSGYLGYFDVDRGINPYRYDAALFRGSFDSEAALKSAIKWERQVNEREMQRHGRNLATAQQNLRMLDSEFNRLQCTLQTDIVGEIHVRLQVLQEVEDMPA